MIKCYNCRAMTGLIASEVVEQAQKDKEILEKNGFTVLCPVISEKVRKTNNTIKSSKDKMDSYWPRDKQMIREANIIFNFSPNLPSLGVIREYGYARYFLWKKVISIFPKGNLPNEGAICYYEDDYVTDSLDDAIKEAIKTHGTWSRRFWWRVRLFKRCFWKFIWYQILQWF